MKFKTLSILVSLFTLSVCQVAHGESLGEGFHLKGGGKVTIEKVTRRNGLVTIKGILTCDKAECRGSTYLTEAFLLDEERGVKYFIIRSDDGKILGSESHVNFKNTRFWAKFTAPAAEISKIDLYLADVEPIEGLSITDQ